MAEKWHGHVIKLKDQIADLKGQIAELRKTMQTIGGAVEEQRSLLEQRTSALRLSLENSSSNPNQPLYQLPSVLKILDNPEVGAILVGNDGRYLLFNSVAQDLLGSSLKKVEDETASEYGLFLPDKATRYTPDSLPWQQCARGARTQEVLIYIKRSDISDGIWIRTISMPISNETGESNGSVAFLLDTTEQVIVEEQIKSLLHTLEDQLASVETAQELLLQVMKKLSIPSVAAKVKEVAILEEAEVEAEKVEPAAEPVVEEGARNQENEKEEFVEEKPDTGEVESVVDEASRAPEPVELEPPSSEISVAVEVLESKLEGFNSESESPFGSEPKSELEPESQVEPQSESKGESQTESQIESHTESQIESHPESHESHSESQIESHTEPQSESQFESKLEPTPEIAETKSEDESESKSDASDPESEINQTLVDTAEHPVVGLEESAPDSDEKNGSEETAQGHERAAIIKAKRSKQSHFRLPSISLARAEQASENSTTPEVVAPDEQEPALPIAASEDAAEQTITQELRSSSRDLSDEELRIHAEQSITRENRVLTNLALVVDDIPVNQKLLCLQLLRYGFEVQTANNGKEAVDAIVKNDYDIVFMDLDMPIMDGVQATVAIRKIEAVTSKHVPIVAMTSYKRDVDRKRCLKAGMDDYLTKGANRTQLLDVIGKFVRPITDTDSELAKLAGQTPVQKSDATADILRLKELHGDEHMRDVSRLFYSSVSTFVDCLQLAIDEKNPHAVMHFVHCIKGPAASLGLTELMSILEQTIVAADNGDWTRVCYQFMKLRANYTDVVGRLKEIFGAEHLNNVAVG